MRIYFKDSQVPEMSLLTRDERHLIKSLTWKAVIRQHPWKQWIQLGVIGLGIGIGMLVGSIAVANSHGQGRSTPINPVLPAFIQFATGMVGAVIGLFVAKQLVLRELRAQWRKENSTY